ncbi:acyltransferase family protein [Sphingomonas canadensis]|uniref:Acyltransferase family protein n=1 Tax=Sphingomonas canadensis TaxID=1219257 RepID=A0ABW3H5I1_9SPHN|nr:acyltransferase [Sphingomonas canadensis]MCW3836112.1 acyltransferase [Sphingomonas canadensis]
MKQGADELRALTAVRGLAAWMVVLFHIRLAMPGVPPEVLAVLAKGYLAVDFFFLLSGFVIWLSYADRLRGGGWAAAGDFLKRRIARIWPLHLFVLAGAAALALLFAATGREAGHFPFAELPLHILLIQNWGFTNALTWNVPAWSISCELGAYLLFPLLAAAIDWRRVPSAAIVAAVAALLVLLHAVFAADGATALGQDIARLGLIRCAIEFAAGTALCALWLRWRERWRMPALLCALIAAALFAAWGAGRMAETLAVPGAFAALLVALALTAGRRGNPLDAAPLHWLGEISYATYLGHYLLWIAFKLAFVSDPRAVPWPLIGLYLLMVLASSAMLYHWVERPAQRWINALRLPWPGLALRAAPPGSPRG